MDFDFTTIGLGVAMFCFVVLAMVAVLLWAKGKLVQSGSVRIVVNNDENKALSVAAGSTLLSTLAGEKLFVPSACGGGGTCAQCKVRVLAGGGELLPTEEGHITRGMAKEHWRLACQVKVKQDMRIQVPDEVFSVKRWTCTVLSNRNVATFIKELRVQLPPGESIDYRSGGYIQIEIPPHDIRFKDFEVEEEYRSDWDRYDIWRYRSRTDETVVRAYSMASYPAEGNVLMLNVRIATPPPRGPEGIPPGMGSSYIFGLKAGDQAVISGPYGEFFLKDNRKEKIFIGGGAGMAPMRSHLMHLFRTEQTDLKVSFWYGARSMREAFYVEDFDAIQADFPNFRWHLALSEPLPEDEWTGLTGFIHQVLLEEYLSKHPDPEECEYYMCGPPMMNAAVLKMLDDLGVDRENIFLDDFGG